MKDMIGLIGCGAMGSALAKGMIKNVGIGSGKIIVFDLNKERQQELAAETGTLSAQSLGDLVPACRHIFIAVKPQDMEGLLYSMKEFCRPEQTVSSIAAGITINYIESCLPAGIMVFRMMPNTPCLLGSGTIAISTGENVSEEVRFEVESLLKPLGLTIRIPEYLMDAATGLSGTGPAYVFLFIETMIDAGVAVGIRRDVASQMVIQNVIGSALMLKDKPTHPAELRNSVTSPAGTSAAALQVLEERGFRSCVQKAVIQATRRAEELRRG